METSYIPKKLSKKHTNKHSANALSNCVLLRSLLEKYNQKWNVFQAANMDIWRYSSQYNAALLLSVNIFAQGMFFGPMHTHHTFTPIIKQQIKLQQ